MLAIIAVSYIAGNTCIIDENITIVAIKTYVVLLT
jgi:hypothetical protein